jgi:hypothetical protein
MGQIVHDNSLNLRSLNVLREVRIPISPACISISTGTDQVVANPSAKKETMETIHSRSPIPDIMRDVGNVAIKDVIIP